MTSHNPYDLNPFSSPVFSSFLPHLLLFFLFFTLCVALSFSTRKGFSGRLFYFFGKVDGWGRRRVGEGAGEGEKKRKKRKKRTTEDVGKEKKMKKCNVGILEAKTKEGKFYLSVVVDRESRYVLGHAFGKEKDKDLVARAVDCCCAWKVRK